MRHSVALRGSRFGLRPVEPDDAAFIVQVRSGNPYIGKGAESLQAQMTWLERYFDRANDYYFVVHDLSSHERHGIAAIYHVDQAARSAEWGRWVLRPGSIAAVESALLVYRCAFEKLSLESVYCRTVLENAQVASFHDSCGLVRRPELLDVELNGMRRRAVEHWLDRTRWPEVEHRLSSIVARLSERSGVAVPP